MLMAFNIKQKFIEINNKNININVISSKKIDSENSYDSSLYLAIIKNENF